MKNIFFLILTLLTLMAIFSSAVYAEKIYKLEYICRGEDPIKRVVNVFLVANTSELIKNKVLKIVAKKNGHIKNWQHLKKGERVTLYLPEKNANKMMMKKYILSIKKRKAKSFKSIEHTVNFYSSMSLVRFDIDSPTVSTDGTLFSKLKYFLLYDFSYQLNSKFGLFITTLLGSESFYPPIGEGAVSLSGTQFFQYAIGPGGSYLFNDKFALRGSVLYGNDTIIYDMTTEDICLGDVAHFSINMLINYQAYRALNTDGDLQLSINYALPATSAKVEFLGGYGGKLATILKIKLSSIAIKIAPTLEYQILNGAYSSQSELTAGLNL